MRGSALYRNPALVDVGRRRGFVVRHLCEIVNRQIITPNYLEGLGRDFRNVTFGSEATVPVKEDNVHTDTHLLKQLAVYRIVRTDVIFQDRKEVYLVSPLAHLRLWSAQV